MAEIFLARLPGVGIEGFEKLVVLKRILPQHALDPELLRMFLDEARLSATLTHPHVTEVYDVGSDDDAPFFAMEYVHGANVRELLRAQSRKTGSDGAALPLEHAIAIVAGAAAGLHYAHDRTGPGGEPLQIVHRDVSPSNVLVSYDGAVKVSDFGIAKWAYQRTRTQEGTLKGKFAYMSPEQCRARPVDRRSDVFALGSILYELTTGTAPFAGASDLDILNQIATGRADAAGVARRRRQLSAGAVRDRDARAGARSRRALPQHAGAAGRAGIVRARRAASRCRRWRWRRSSRSCSPRSWRRGARRSAKESRWPSTWRRGRRRRRSATARSARRRMRSRARRAAASSGAPGAALRGGRRVRRRVRGGRRRRDQGLDAARNRPAGCDPRRGDACRAANANAERSLPPTTLPPPSAGALAPLPVATAATKTKAKIRQAGRQARVTPATGEAKAQPATADSRLGAWDPDSPVPP